MGRTISTEKYRVGPLHDKRAIEVVMQAEDAEDAREKAWPKLSRLGVAAEDPLVVGRDRPNAGRNYSE